MNLEWYGTIAGSLQFEVTKFETSMVVVVSTFDLYLKLDQPSTRRGKIVGDPFPAQRHQI